MPEAAASAPTGGVDGPRRVEPLPGSSARPVPPYVHVRRLRSYADAWTVTYHSQRGAMVTIGQRRRAYQDALSAGKAASNLHEIPLEIDP